MARSKLKVALAAQKGTDFQKLKEKKKHKQALKEKAKKAPAKDADDEDDEEEDDDDYEDIDEDEEDEDEEDAERNGLIDDEASEDEDDEDEEDDEELGTDFIAAMDDSDDSDSEVEMEAKIERPKKAAAAAAATKKTKKAKKSEGTTNGEEEDEDEEDEEAEEEEDEDEELAWSDLDEEARAGLAARVRRRPTINNTAALTAALTRIRMFAPGDKKVPFALHQSVTSETVTAESIPDVQDDVARELQLYRQSREAAVLARKRLRAEGVPFSRPTDYFAEMLKDDGHMAQVKAKLVEAATAKKAAAEARKQRDLKKFGKQVQVARLQERAKQKKETLEKIKTLKRKRQESGATSTHEADLFDVAVDHELAAGGGAGSKRKASVAGGGRNGVPQPNAKRQKKNEKYGFGGKKRHSKSGDALSSGDLSGFNAKRMKSGGGGRPGGRPGGGGFKASRPGKARRKAAAGRR